MSIRPHAAACIAALTLQAFPAAAVPGNPDPTFGTFGLATMPAGTSLDTAYGAGGAGLRYVTGEAERETAGHLFLARFQSNGTLEPTFGTGGRSMLRLDASSAGYAVREQSDGKVLVAGVHYARPGPEMLVARFNADGSLDTSFATGGAYTRPVGTYSYASAVAIQGDGKILVAGAANSTANGTYDMALIRLNADGTPDATFGTSGLKTLDFRGGHDTARAVSEVAGNKILVIGQAATAAGQVPNSAYDYAVARLNADGSVDTTFGPAGQNGLVLIDVNGDYDEADALEITADAFWLGGTSIRASDQRWVFSVVKITQEGLLDGSFGGTGARIVAPGNARVYARSIAVGAAKVVIGGSMNGSFTMAQFNLDGTLDAAFGTGGTVVDPDPGCSGSCTGMIALAYDTGGAILAAGTGPEGSDVNKQDLMRTRYTATGARDTAYGTGGKTSTNLFDLSWEIRAVAVLPDGKTVLAGSLYDAFDSDFAVMRLTAAGARDNSFGQRGVRLIGFGNSDDRAFSLLANADGTLTVAGRSFNAGTTSFALARLEEDGSLDYTFGTNGLITQAFAQGVEVHAIAPAPGGKFVVTGPAYSGADRGFMIARYSANGVIDPAFGMGGTNFTLFGGGLDVPEAVAHQLDGKIVVAGYSRVGSFFDFAVARYNANGTLDASFGSGGNVIVAVGAANDLAHSLALLPNGKILVAGEVFNSGTNNDMAVVRLNANGALDSSFGGTGIVVVNFASGPDAAFAMAVQSNDRIVLAGTAADGPGGTAARGMALARLNADGSTDTGFGFGYAAGGRFVTDVTGSVDTAFALALRRDGRIVAAGVAGIQWAATRSLGDAHSPHTRTDLSADGKSDMLYRNATNGSVHRMVMGGFTIHQGATAYTEPDTAWKIVGDADFNGDGYGDLLYRNSTTGAVAIVPFEVTSRTGPPAVFYTEPSANWKIVHTPDLDGDGRADILWWNSPTGQVYAQLLDGASIVAQGLMYAEPNLAWKIVAVGDFTGSGKQNQLLWRNGTTGQVYLMTIAISGGAFSQAGVQIYQEPNTAWKIVGAADFDGDGKSDILWRNDTTGAIYIMLMNGSAIAAQGLMYSEPNLAWKIVALGDYNGDGKSDVLWRNEVTGQVYMLLMNGLAIASQAMVYTEANTAWKLLGIWEYGQATGILP